MREIKMACPFCGKELEKGERKKYETLIDHVSNPNMSDYPLRDTWVCSCAKSKETFWDMFGDSYSKFYIAGKTDAIQMYR